MKTGKMKTEKFFYLVVIFFVVSGCAVHAKFDRPTTVYNSDGKVVQESGSWGPTLSFQPLESDGQKKVFEGEAAVEQAYATAIETAAKNKDEKSLKALQDIPAFRGERIIIRAGEKSRVTINNNGYATTPGGRRWNW